MRWTGDSISAGRVASRQLSSHASTLPQQTRTPHYPSGQLSAADQAEYLNPYASRHPRQRPPDAGPPASQDEASHAHEEQEQETGEAEAELDGFEELERESRAQAAPASADDSQQLGDQIYVLGTDVQGKYLTHALSHCNFMPPVRLFVHKRSMQRYWEEGGRCIHLHRGEQHLPSSRATTELIGHHNLWAGRPLPGQSEEHIGQLIVTVPASSVVRSFESIRHRVDEASTVCLVQDGLGVAEALNEAYFPDPAARPLYILGHTTHKLQAFEQKVFTLAEVKQGRLYLSSLPHDLAQTRVRRHPPVERWTRPGHFLSLLTSAPGLQAGGFSLEQFFGHKLPHTIFHSVMDPLTVVLNCTYDKLVGNTYAMQLIDQLLGEILSVVTRMPELGGSTMFNDLRAGTWRKRMFRRLAQKKGADSRMRSLTARGFESDIDYLNGYFVKRGRELGIKCPTNETMIWMVKARHAAELKQRRKEISFGEWDG